MNAIRATSDAKDANIKSLALTRLIREVCSYQQHGNICGRSLEEDLYGAAKRIKNKFT